MKFGDAAYLLANLNVSDILEFLGKATAVVNNDIIVDFEDLVGSVKTKNSNRHSHQ